MKVTNVTYRTFWQLIRLAWPLKNWIALAVLLGVVTIGSGIGLMATSAYLISVAALHPSEAALAIAIVGVRFFGITRGIFRYLERYVSHSITFRLLSQFRVWFYRAIEPLAPARLMALRNGHATDFSSGDLLSRIVSDIETLQDFYVRVLAPPIVAACVGLALWFFLNAYQLSLAITWLSFFLVAGIAVPLLTHLLSYSVGEQIVIARSQLNRQLVEGVQGMADIVAFGREQDQLERVRRSNATLVRLQARMAQISGLQNSLSNLLMNLTAWTMLLVAVPFVRSGQLNGIYLALIVLGVMASFEAVLPLPAAFQQLGRSLTAARRLFEIVEAQPIVRDAETYSPVPQNYDIEVRDLKFRYNAAEPYILNGINFTIKQGHCIAIVGPSGAGKSTLTSLLERFWEYEEGQIQLGGHPLQAYKQQDVHKMISVVAQDTHLFNTTIRENLLIARPQATQEELEEVAKRTQIHEFITSLPQGYTTPIGEQGLRLSGGERQRIAIARAMLKDAPILILDEATANLDTQTEQSVLQTLHTFMQGRTTLIITHRPVGLDMADEILAL